MKLTLPLPPSTNVYWRSICRGSRPRILVSKDGRAYRKRARLLAVAQAQGDPFTVPVCVSLHIVTPTRRGDLDNRIKPTLDALQGIAYDDDKRVVQIVATRGVDKANPRVDVEVVPVAAH